jgi:hypothetical protein
MTALDESPATTDERRPTAAERSRKRRRWLWVAAVLALVVVLGVLYLSRLRPLDGPSSSNGQAAWLGSSQWVFSGGSHTDVVAHVSTHDENGLTVLTTPPVGTRFGFVAEVQNLTGITVHIEKVTTDWQSISPQIVTAQSVYATSMPSGQYDPAQLTRSEQIPVGGLTLKDGDSLALGQQFTIPACATKPSAGNAFVAMGQMHVTYSYLFFFHRTVQLPAMTWWGLRNPKHC